MTTEARTIPDEAFFHITVKHQTIEQLFHELYEHPSAKSRQHFLMVNKHLDQYVRPDQMVILTQPGAQQCLPFESDLMKAARRVDQ